MTLCPDCGHENIDGTDDCGSCGASLQHLSLPNSKGGLTKKILEGTIRDLKPRNAIQVSGETSITEAAELMRANRMGCIIVLAEDKVIGIMTERDLLFGVEGSKDPAKTKVKQIMHEDPICLRVGDPVSFAFHHMSVGGYRHLPIYLEDDSVGMVSARDLLRYLTL